MFKVDDGFYDHPKVRAIPRGNVRKGAVSLWALAGSWADRYLTDGLIPAHQVPEFGATTKEAAALVVVGLWHDSGHACDRCPPVPSGHYLYHEWDQCNDLKVDVEKRRSKARDRMRKLRAGELGKPDQSGNVRDLFADGSREQAGEQ